MKRTIDALQADAPSAPVGSQAALIVFLALVNGAARLVSRFAITGASPMESDLRNDLYAALQAYLAAFYGAHRTGDLMARATSDITAVRSLVGFGSSAWSPRPPPSPGRWPP